MKITAIKNTTKTFLLITVGTLMFCLGTTYFILPANIYSGGVLGTSQVLQVIFEDILHIKFPADIQLAGILNFAFNIPLFILAYKSMSKMFLVKTFFSIGLQTLMFTLLTPPVVPIMEEVLSATLIGGVITGAGIGIVLLAGSSTGGVDILGMYFTLKYKNFSVGNFAIIYNAALYLACSMLFDISIAIYSVISVFVTSIVVDKFHAQNIRIMAIIFTNSEDVAKNIITEMHRGVTMWGGKGVYTMEDKQILVTVISKYEIANLKALIKRHDENAFLILNEGLDVMGNYEKRMDA